MFSPVSSRFSAFSADRIGHDGGSFRRTMVGDEDEARALLSFGFLDEINEHILKIFLPAAREKGALQHRPLGEPLAALHNSSILGVVGTSGESATERSYSESVDESPSWVGSVRAGSSGSSPRGGQLGGWLAASLLAGEEDHQHGPPRRAGAQYPRGDEDIDQQEWSTGSGVGPRAVPVLGDKEKDRSETEPFATGKPFVTEQHDRLSGWEGDDELSFHSSVIEDVGAGREGSGSASAGEPGQMSRGVGTTSSRQRNEPWSTTVRTPVGRSTSATPPSSSSHWHFRVAAKTSTLPKSALPPKSAAETLYGGRDGPPRGRARVRRVVVQHANKSGRPITAAHLVRRVSPRLAVIRKGASDARLEGRGSADVPGAPPFCVVCGAGSSLLSRYNAVSERLDEVTSAGSSRGQFSADVRPGAGWPNGSPGAGLTQPVLSVRRLRRERDRTFLAVPDHFSMRRSCYDNTLPGRGGCDNYISYHDDSLSTIFSPAGRLRFHTSFVSLSCGHPFCARHLSEMGQWSRTSSRQWVVCPACGVMETAAMPFIWGMEECV